METKASITVFTTDKLLSMYWIELKWTKLIQSTHFQPMCLENILILYSHLWLGFSSHLAPSDSYPAQEFYMYVCSPANMPPPPPHRFSVLLPLSYLGRSTNQRAPVMQHNTLTYKLL